MPGMILTPKPSSTNKNSRIVGTLEPLGASGRITLPVDLADAQIAQANDFNPALSDNDDDWLDALQRAVEMHESGHVRIDWSAVLG